MKTCTNCNIKKPFEDFAVKKSNKSTGRAAKCKKCSNIYLAKWRDSDRLNYYIVYYLPKEHYIGITNQPKQRMGDHKCHHGRDITDWRVMYCTEIKKEHLKFFDSSNGHQVIDKDLSSHLPNAYPVIGSKLDSIMAPSLILLNHPKELSDYSAYAFPLLRGSEGVLKSVLSEYGIEIRNNFGDYFTYSQSKGKCIWAKDCSSFFQNAELEKSLLHLYRIYHKERHTIFHVDSSIETSRVLNFEQAIDIVTEGLSIIDKVYFYHN